MRARILTQPLQAVEEEGEGPFAVGATLHVQVPLVMQALPKPPLDVFPTSQATVVHPHQAIMVERVAVVLGERALRRGSDVGENKSRGRLGGNAMKIGAVPCGNRRREETRGGAEFRVSIKANAESIGVVLASSCILREREVAGVRVVLYGTADCGRREITDKSQSRVEGLLENRMSRIENQLGQ